jgi:hypothetical protein
MGMPPLRASRTITLVVTLALTIQSAMSLIVRATGRMTGLTWRSLMEAYF